MIEPVFAVLVGLFMAAAVYLILSRSLVRVLMGLSVLGNGINLLIFVAGRLARGAPPIATEGGAAAAMANPLPQALILTAIVIGFALFAFLMALAYRTLEDVGTDDTHEMRVAEPGPAGRSPLGY
jgi:multicomponent Na+:H+ antiporter subunit C